MTTITDEMVKRAARVWCPYKTNKCPGDPCGTCQGNARLILQAGAADEIERLQAALKECRDLIENHEKCGPGSTDFSGVVRGIDALLNSNQQQGKES